MENSILKAIEEKAISKSIKNYQIVSEQNDIYTNIYTFFIKELFNDNMDDFINHYAGFTGYLQSINWVHTHNEYISKLFYMYVKKELTKSLLSYNTIADINNLLNSIDFDNLLKKTLLFELVGESDDNIYYSKLCNYKINFVFNHDKFNELFSLFFIKFYHLDITIEIDRQDNLLINNQKYIHTNIGLIESHQNDINRFQYLYQSITLEISKIIENIYKELHVNK